MNRSQIIIKTSIIGIIVNLILVIFKMTIGFLTNSIAIILDGINNLGDALSSIITIIGTKLAGKAPDKKHPYGYGRIEYLTSVLIAVIVLMAGITSVRESADKIIHPQETSYSIASLVIIAMAVAAKLVCGRYVKSVGERINAGSLIASGSDAFFDAILSLSTLIGAIISMVWGIGLEGILGLIISVIIIKAGLEMLLETLNSIIGIRADRDLSEALKETVNSFEEVRGAYDLALHNYGPAEIIGSVHIEVDDHMTAREIHKLTRQIAQKIYEEFNIILTVGVYASNTSDEQVMEIKGKLSQILTEYPSVLQMHGFYAESETQTATFDLVIDFNANPEEVQKRILAELQQLFPKYRFYIVADSDYSD